MVRAGSSLAAGCRPDEHRRRACALCAPPPCPPLIVHTPLLILPADLGVGQGAGSRECFKTRLQDASLAYTPFLPLQQEDAKFMLVRWAARAGWEAGASGAGREEESAHTGGWRLIACCENLHTCAEKRLVSMRAGWRVPAAASGRLICWLHAGHDLLAARVAPLREWQAAQLRC